MLQSFVFSLRNISSPASRFAHYGCKVLVVGGGTGGCAVAAKLSKVLSKDEVLILDPSEKHYYQPLFTLVGAGVYTLKDSYRPQKDVLPDNTKWIKDTAVEFNPKQNYVITSMGHKIEYDFMLLALGIETNYDKIPGLLQGLKGWNGICSNYSAKYVEKTFEVLKNFESGNAIFTYPDSPVKCPGAPQKICYLVDDYLRKKGKRQKANVIYNTSLPVIFGVKKYADALWNVVKSRDIEVNLRTNLVEVRPDKNEAVFENLDKPGEMHTLKYSMLHVTPPMSTPLALRNNKELSNSAGFADVDPGSLRHNKFSNIFAIGDCSSSPNSKTAAAAAAQSAVVFHNMKAVMDGTGESGKTTIIKQMKILHINGFTERELKEHIPNIRANLHESIFAILDNMDKIIPPIDVEHEASKSSMEYLLSLGPDYSKYEQEYFDHVELLSLDPGVQKALKRSNEFQLLDCAEYFLGRIGDIRRIEYVPNTQDILFCRVKTTSINKIEFTVSNEKKYGSGQPIFWMYDVGGQRGERRKWIQVFEGIEAILFLIAASEFDQQLREDQTRNRFQESLTLFNDIYGSRFLRTAGLIVFLNKQDILKRKIQQGKRLQDYFPDYHTYISNDKKSFFNDDYEKAKSFMKDKILELVKPLSVEHVGFIPGKFIHEVIPKRDVYIHYTVATDTRNIRTVFDCVQEIVLRQTIHQLF